MRAARHLCSLRVIVRERRGTGTLSPCTGYSDDQLVARGDRQVEWLVQAIIISNTWQRGRNALFVVWDQGNGAPLQDPAVAIAVTNYCVNWVQDPTPYTHYSLLKTIEAVFRLPFLGHATDSTTKTMAPMLTRVHDNHNDDCTPSQEHNECQHTFRPDPTVGVCLDSDSLSWFP